MPTKSSDLSYVNNLIKINAFSEIMLHIETKHLAKINFLCTIKNKTNFNCIERINRFVNTSDVSCDSALAKIQIISKIEHPLQTKHVAKMQQLNATQIALKLKKSSKT